MIWSTSKLVLRLLGAVIAGLALIVAAGAWRLSAGPISLGFLTPYLQDAMSLGGADGLHIEIGDTILAWQGFDRGLGITLVDVRFRDPAGVEAARLPLMDVSFSGAGIVRGHLEPTSIDLQGPVMRLARNADGSVEVLLGQGDDLPQASNEAFVAFLANLTLPPEAGKPGAALTRVAVRDADITFDDRLAGAVWRAPAADLFLNRDEGGIRGDLRLNLLVGTDPVPIAIAARFDQATQRVQAYVTFENLVPARLSTQGPPFTQLVALALPVGGSVTVLLDSAGQPERVDFDLSGGGGQLVLPDLYAEPAPVTGLRATGTYDATQQRTSFEQLRIEIGIARIELKGVVTSGKATPDIDLAGSFSNLTVPEVKRYWPTGMAAGARTWFVANIQQGTVRRGSVRLRLTAAEIDSGAIKPDAIEITGEFFNTRASYLGQLPPLREAQGYLKITPALFELTLQSGQIGELTLPEATVRLEEGPNRSPIWNGTIELVASGANREVLRILDLPPLGLTRRLGLDPAALGGVSATRARFVFPLADNLRAEDVRFAAASNVQNGSWAKAFGSVDIANAALAIEVTAAGMAARGNVTLNGVPAEVGWAESFDARASSGQVTLRTTLDDAARKALKLDIGEVLKGTVGVALTAQTAGQRVTATTVDFDLMAASIDLGALRWRKQVGQPAQARVVLRPTQNGGFVVQNIDARGPDLVALGEAEFDGTNKLLRLELSRLAFAGNDVSVNLRPGERGGHTVAIGGRRLDVSPYLDAYFDSSGTGDETDIPPLRLSLQVQQLYLSETRSLINAVGDATYGERLDGLRLSGSINNEAPVTATVVTGPDRVRRLAIASSNAGALARTTGLFEDAGGGSLTISGTIVDDPAGKPYVEGKMEIDNVQIRNAPALARVLTLASLTGILEILNGQGINFAKANVPYRFRGNVIELREGRAFGPSLGITVDGDIDRRKDQLALTGTLVPAYTINSVLGSIPLIGTLLIGRQGEGIIALTYSVRGPIEDPSISINPLSALAPGFLRNFFSIFTGARGLGSRENGAAAEQAQPPAGSPPAPSP